MLGQSEKGRAGEGYTEAPAGDNGCPVERKCTTGLHPGHTGMRLGSERQSEWTVELNGTVI